MDDPHLHRVDFAEAFNAAFLPLQVAVESACRAERVAAADRGWPAQVAAAVHAALAWAAADPAAAAVVTNAALGHGRAGFARYDRMLDHFTAALRAGREESPDSDLLPEVTEKAMVGGLATLIANRVEQGRESELPSIAAEAIQFVLTPYLGAEEARRTAAEHAA